MWQSRILIPLFNIYLVLVDKEKKSVILSSYEYFKNDAYAGNPGCGPDTSNPKNEVFKDQPQDIKAYSSSLWTKVKSH